MQPPVALHRQPEQAVSASPSGDADEVRRHLMEAVRQARDVLKDSMPLQQSTAADYARKTKHLSKKVQALAKDWPRSGADQSTQIMQVALGEYAATPNSFFAKRRALQHWFSCAWKKRLKTRTHCKNLGLKRKTHLAAWHCLSKCTRRRFSSTGCTSSIWTPVRLSEWSA